MAGEGKAPSRVSVVALAASPVDSFPTQVPLLLRGGKAADHRGVTHPSTVMYLCRGLAAWPCIVSYCSLARRTQ